MRAMIVVVILPLTQFVVEQMDVVTDALLIEELIELLVVDAMRSLDFAVQVRSPRSDVAVTNVPTF